MKQSMRAAVLVLYSCLMLTLLAGRASAALPDMNEPVRVFHFVLRKVSLDDARKMTREAKRAGFNAIQATVADGVRLDHAPWKPLPDAWTKAEFLAWVNETRSQGLEFIPELKLLTHQEKFFQNGKKELMFNRSTYDPRNEKTYEFVFALLDEIITAIHPKAIHIAHDEVAGHNTRSRGKWLGPGEDMLPAELFLKDVLRVHGHLKKRGVETWIWGDMLINPREFPGMLDKHLHGSAQGYGKALRDKLPRDIVICDWHFTDDQLEFPSLSVMRKEGFRVIGATWKKGRTIRNFSSFAAGHGASGMIATTWFHVQRREWDVVEKIIRTSGEVFLKDFPDGRR